ncbi:MAG: transposase, partial [Desulfobulbaceae bacterium]|nr:transposase [Desulfobulbaceae bacterium]
STGNSNCRHQGSIIVVQHRPFLSGIRKHFSKEEITVDWFHVVQIFTKAVNKVRVLETKKRQLPKATRWAVLKNEESTTLSENERRALAELDSMDLFTAIAWRVKERLRWVRKAATAQAAKWRLSNFLLCMAETDLTRSPVLKPIISAIETVIRHRQGVSEPTDIYQHDLPDRLTGWQSAQIHLKRRRAPKVNESNAQALKTAGKLARQDGDRKKCG